ncbi:unnamed protein product [Trypanosoma congolense IL3000]|uniref:WGS project CAEQ00000000 data, annotated contig 1997 n=1 Tax=Trypanosoma congolense (strain IL3000) TaxID=1068625 RepID=F9WAN7_TRYCI|nr:unnamed protein product [Trypanosoma congolense IL3000]
MKCFRVACKFHSRFSLFAFCCLVPFSLCASFQFYHCFFSFSPLLHCSACFYSFPSLCPFLFFIVLRFVGSPGVPRMGEAKQIKRYLSLNAVLLVSPLLVRYIDIRSPCFFFLFCASSNPRRAVWLISSFCFLSVDCTSEAFSPNIFFLLCNLRRVLNI